jgi:hypothetical protein
LSKDSFENNYLERNFERVELATKVQKTLNDYYNIKDVYNDIYPSYFGGMYISDDASNLVIQIVKNNIPKENSEEFSFYNEILNMDDSIQIEYVNNSYNELNEANTNIASVFSANDNSYQNISSSYIDIMNNSVTVELIDNTPIQQIKVKNTISKAKSSIDSNLIKFTKGKENVTQANINAGGYISAKSGYSCSMGMRVKYNGKNGYLTAGHCTNGIGTTIQSGTVRARQLANNQKFDYAFIETNSSYTPTNTLEKYSNSPANITKLGLVNYCPTVTVNMAVSKNGITTGYTTGKVTGVNASVYYSDINMTITGMVKTNVYSQPGDSGGVVMIPRTDANGGAVGLGILSGGNDSTMYFSDINVLPVALQNRY